MKHNVTTPNDVGLYIPPYVRQCPGLKPGDWLLLAQIIQLSRGERGCFATREWLTKELCFSRRSAFRHFDILEKRGLLRRVGNRLLTPCDSDPVWKCAASRPETRMTKSKRSRGRKAAPELKETAPGDSGKTPPDDSAKSARNSAKMAPDDSAKSALNSAKMALEDSAKSALDSARMALPTVPNRHSDSAKMALPSEHEVNEKLNKNLNPSREPSLAPPGFFENPLPEKTRAVSPLKSKLVEICGLKPLLGKKAFPGAMFGKTLAVLQELDAAPEELVRFVAWWREEAMSFRHQHPKLHHVARHFHESRPAAAEPEPAAAPAPQPAAGTSSAAPAGGEEEPETEEQREARWRTLDRRFVKGTITRQYADALETGDEAEIAKVEARFRRWFPDEPLPEADAA